VANPRKRRSHRRRSRSRAHRKSNPFRSSKRYSFRRRHTSRRNPGVAGFSTNELLKLAAGAAGGVIASKYLTQMVLGSSNTGTMGYAASAVATLALAWAAHKFASKDVATGVVAGGLGALALRIFQENVSGTSTSMSGLGDPDMAALGIGMGDYKFGQIGVPARFTMGSSPQTLALAAEAARASRRRG
jgi:hypothetical protein